MSYQIAKGVFDILPKDPDPEGAWRESHLWLYIEGAAREIAAEYGFKEIRTPVFEKTELFLRSIGETTDIVVKEMYTFMDKANRSLTLRPEGTASVMRALIEKNLFQLQPIQKIYYLFPMFRYERQQAGRYRQHHQFGAEATGSDSPLQDAEVIDLLYTFLQRLGLRGLTLHLNSIGDLESRKRYREALKEALRPHLKELSAESQERFETNPLRILDSKNPDDRKLLQDVPSILDFLDAPSREHFEQVCAHLKAIEIPFKINPNLVRGLDYYNRTVFEITAEELGAQNSLGGGGRYDGLIRSLGGPEIPAFGFGAGLERIIQTMLAQKVFLPLSPSPLLFLIPLGDAAQKKCFQLLSKLHKQHISAEMDFSGKKLKNAMRYADMINARFIAVIGENELNSGKIELKEMSTGDIQTISIDLLAETLAHV